ncbi:MAG: hypothetical protein ACOYO0_05025 [Sandarakinorhabdus sp.]
MLKHNQWTHGERDFALPPLPAHHIGKPGPMLMSMTFDAAIGAEVCLMVKEEPGYAEQMGRVTPLNLLATTGMIRTPFGLVAYIIWTVAAQSEAEVQFEHFLNPAEMSTLQLLASAANQTHFKLVVANCITSAVTAFVDYENVFDLGGLAEAIVGTMGHEPPSDFGRAVDHVKATVPLQTLLGEPST